MDDNVKRINFPQEARDIDGYEPELFTAIDLESSQIPQLTQQQEILIATLVSRITPGVVAITLSRADGEQVLTETISRMPTPVIVGLLEAYLEVVKNAL